jgi:heme/copper-type cytochrome/quinol oxidase subunit 1
MSMSGHIIFILLLGPLLFAYAIMYAVIPDLTKKKMNKTLGEIHFWLTLFGRFGFVLLFVVIGGEGSIRREASMPGAFDWVTQWLLFFRLKCGAGSIHLRLQFRKDHKEETDETRRIQIHQLRITMMLKID